ncbi:MAG: FGGY-family carbohydrate kinase [Lachnospiraceae bacterium]|nr:FGGY-family carbohydrate kinase [Lachnospiraceae bacterium]
MPITGRKVIMMENKEIIEKGLTSLGIEFGSTNIKAVLIDDKGNVLAKGNHRWENSLKDGIWTYSYKEIDDGIRDTYSDLRKSVEEKYGVTIKTIGAIGISAMMHGIIPLDTNGEALAEFQTWRNSNTQAAADQLTELFNFNIPLRWTIAHLYQYILDDEKFLKDLDFATTLDSYMTWKLTGQQVTGIGDASGIFPIDSDTKDYDQKMVDAFDKLIADKGYSWKLRDVLPKVLVAGQEAGKLTEAGAVLLDESGNLKAGIPFAPPEGDAGTGMVATDAVAPRTGNVSAGTSTFAMVVTEGPLKSLHREIDMVTTPDGAPCAMSHANNGTSDINAWHDMFEQFVETLGLDPKQYDLYTILCKASLDGDADCGGLLNYGYYSGEGVTKLNEGRPLYVRMPDSKFTLANMMRANIYSALAAVKLGMDILQKDEKIKIDRITGHGGLFGTPGVAQKYLAAAINTPVTVLSTATEGGPWGMALLALYMKDASDRSLTDFLDNDIFAQMKGDTIAPDEETVAGYGKFIDHYKAGLAVESSAIDNINW